MSSDRFDVLVVEHGDSLIRLAYLLCRDHGRAEDLVQESLIRALRASRRDVWPLQPGPYLRTIVLREFLSWKRRRSSSEVVGLPPEYRPGYEIDSGVDERALMWQLLGSLKPRPRAVLVLRYYEDLPDDEIGTILGCAPATVRTIASRALKSLREHPDLGALAGANSTPKETS